LRTADTIRLLVLAALWGGSFIFMRILAPLFGPVLTADLRALLAGIALVIYFRIIRFDAQWKIHWRKYLFIGAINSALPFLFFSFAALYIPASLSVILNSTSPLFGAIFSVLWLQEKFTFRKVIALFLGIAGVVLVTRVGQFNTKPMFWIAVTACIIASALYGLIATYIKRYATGVNSLGIAGGSQLMAGLLRIPVIPFSPMRSPLNLEMIIGVICFALLCSALAYILYFRLIADIGPTGALTVTFLMPMFGMVWGKIFLHEIITTTMVLGAALIIFSTLMVLSSKK
jgi:drug/metabolite transporter (DMT)-like permease